MVFSPAGGDPDLNLKETLMTQPISIRMADNEIELLDAIAAGLSDRTGVKHSRADVVRAMMKRLATPEENTPNAARWRHLHREVFPA